MKKELGNSFNSLSLLGSFIYLWKVNKANKETWNFAN